MRMFGEITRFTAPRLPDLQRSGRVDPGGGDEAGSRVLVAVDPIKPNGCPLSDTRRPSAAFLAHLIATGQRAPQTRAGRRADPTAAAVAYGLALSPAPMKGCLLRRCV
jgi:hypothetical protein